MGALVEYPEIMDILRAARVILASMRLTRVVVEDDIGKWWIKDPIDRAMDKYAINAYRTAGAGVVEPWWWKYRSGLDCQWCIGFWVGAGVLLADKAVRGTKMEAPFTYLQEALAVNVIGNAIADRIGTYGWVDGEVAPSAEDDSPSEDGDHE